MNFDFEEQLGKELQAYLIQKNEIDIRFPQAPDIEDKWTSVAQSYLPDGVREFREFPSASLGWMMFVGMAVTQFWEEDWEIYGQMPDLYLFLRDKEGFDTMDEYVRREVLHLKDEKYELTGKLVSECAQHTHSFLQHAHIEPGTREAFEAYVCCLHQLYLMGMAIQLHRLGYSMQPLNG